MVRDESDVIETTIRYHLDQGLSALYIIDNGSTDGTLERIRRLAKNDCRVRWSQDLGKFHQSEAFTNMARDAARCGAQWIVPFDADEFWFAVDGLPNELSKYNCGCLRASVVNYIQRRDVIHLSEGAILEAEYRAFNTIGPEEECWRLVEDEKISFVEMEYPPKHISRATDQIEISGGNHAVFGMQGQALIAPTIACLHVPFRAKEMFKSKVRQSERLDEACYPEMHGWHLRRLARLKKADLLDEEWIRNSHLNGMLDAARGPIKLAYDPILRHLLSRYSCRAFNFDSTRS